MVIQMAYLQLLNATFYTVCWKIITEVEFYILLDHCLASFKSSTSLLQTLQSVLWAECQARAAGATKINWVWTKHFHKFWCTTKLTHHEKTMKFEKWGLKEHDWTPDSILLSLITLSSWPEKGKYHMGTAGGLPVYISFFFL